MSRSRTVDHDSPIPFYVQLREILESFIGEGKWLPGERLPAEQELCDTYDVSRSVVRQTLQEMERNGLIVKRKGRGSFVAKPKIHESLVQKLTGFYQDMVERGFTPVTKVLRQSVEPANAKVALQLGLEPGTLVHNIERLRYVNDEPIALVQTFVPQAVCPGLSDIDLSNRSLYAVLEDECGVMLSHGRRTIEAVASFVSVVVALTLTDLGYLAFALGVAVGFGVGLLNGIVHVRLLLPSFIVTLASAGVWTGVGLLVSDATSVPINADHRDLVAWITGTILGVPNELIIATLVLVFGLFMQHYTPFGRYSRAIGSGALAGLAGVMLAGRLSSGGPRIADQFLLPAIATVVVGGTSISGGVGSIWRTFVGAMIVSVIRTGMNFVGVDVFFAANSVRHCPDSGRWRDD
jgi:DNA-binding GntR family transcriptional regulator